MYSYREIVTWARIAKNLGATDWRTLSQSVEMQQGISTAIARRDLARYAIDALKGNLEFFVNVVVSEYVPEKDEMEGTGADIDAHVQQEIEAAKTAGLELVKVHKYGCGDGGTYHTHYAAVVFKLSD